MKQQPKEVGRRISGAVSLNAIVTNKMSVASLRSSRTYTISGVWTR